MLLVEPHESVDERARDRLRPILPRILSKVDLPLVPALVVIIAKGIPDDFAFAEIGEMLAVEPMESVDERANELLRPDSLPVP